MKHEMVGVALVLMGVACGGKGAEAPPAAEPSQEEATTAGKVEGDPGGSRAAQIEQELAGQPESAGQGGDAQTEEWLAILRAELPGEFCKDGTFFRSCFAVTRAECMRVSLIEFDACVKQHRAALPKIRTVEDGGKGGEILGRCTGEGYYDALETKFKNTAKCNDPSQW